MGAQALPDRLAVPDISRERGRPSIGAPAGIGEHLLAVPAGVDGSPAHDDEGRDKEGAHRPRGTGAPVGGAAGAAGVAADWERFLDELEARLVAWRVALRGDGPFPDDYRWSGNLGACPDHLRGRAQAVLASQRDVEDELTARRAALGALLHGIGTTERRLPVPLFVDQRS